jgi:polyhydroxyalkanoate synthesis regulator phasin
MRPWISDVADYFMYGRTDRSDMAYLVNLIDLSKSIYKLADNYSYYKLHNTFNKALAVASQTSGFAVSNIWRDAVALWNAVAGELGYGELKFQVSEDTHSEGYKRMYDAIASGDEDRAGYLYGQLLSNGVEEDKIYNGLTKCVKEAFQDGNITEEEATKLIKDIIDFVGKTDSEGNPPTAEDIYWMIDRWKYTKKEGYSRYDDLYEAMENGDPTSALEWHIEKKTEAYLEEARREAEKDGKTFSETKAKREAKSKAESSVKSAISSYWKPKYKEAYKKGDTEEMKRIRYILRDTKLYGSVSDILDTCKGWLKD